MAVIGRDSSKGRFTLRRHRGATCITDNETGKTLPLKGYGALKGVYVVRKGIDLSKPIFEQVSKLALRQSAAHRRSGAKRHKS